MTVAVQPPDIDGNRRHRTDSASTSHNWVDPADSNDDCYDEPGAPGPVVVNNFDPPQRIR